MPRDIDDDAASRISDADEQLRNTELLNVADELAQARDIRRDLRRVERDLARAKSVARARGAALSVAVASLLAGLGWTIGNWGTPSRFIGPDIICGVLIVLSTAAAVVDLRRRGTEDSRAELEDKLDVRQEALRIVSAIRYPSITERRSLYREDVAGVIEQHRTDSRRYRRTHNTLQNLIMAGSTTTTTVAALDTGNELTWQNITIIAIGFTVTLAAAFTGYYKFRERSYFLQQTADAIEEEANAVALGIGPYKDFGPDQEQEALKVFTQRVEDHRNEQRRRQQQLDQPADQAAPSSQPPAA